MNPNGAIVDVGSVPISDSGIFNYTFVTGSMRGWISGRYTVRVHYGARGITAETNGYFDYEAEMEPIPADTFSPIPGIAIFREIRRAHYDELLSSANSFFTDAIVGSGSFFDPTDLTTVRQAPRVPSASRGSELAKTLRELPAGMKNWSQYQNLCKEILIYCLSPGLSEPEEEVPNEDQTQRKDLVFKIPHATTDMWQYVTLTYGAQAVIVDCKNYESQRCPLLQPKGDNVSMLSKTVMIFGIIVSRQEISTGAKAEQKRLWNEDDKLILCLNDAHLLKMLELKEKGDDPAKVIDDAQWEFRKSL